MLAHSLAITRATARSSLFVILAQFPFVAVKGVVGNVQVFRVKHGSNLCVVQRAVEVLAVFHDYFLYRRGFFDNELDTCFMSANLLAVASSRLNSFTCSLA